MKRCSNCHPTKTYITKDFYEQWHYVDNKLLCGICRGKVQYNAVRNKARYQANKDSILAEKKQYYSENKDEILDYTHKWYRENREKQLEYHRQYYISAKQTTIKKVK